MLDVLTVRLRVAALLRVTVSCNFCFCFCVASFLSLLNSAFR